MIKWCWFCIFAILIPIVIVYPLQYILCESESSPLLECSAGRLIMVNDANYGRTDSLKCPHSTIDASKTYDRTTSVTTRTKEKCDLKQSCLPSKSGAGDPYQGVYKYVNVTYECLILGGWGNWEPFGDCSTTCGKGVQSFQRKCNNPVPETNEMYCIGGHIQNLECNAITCQGSWGCWQTVGHCSHSCGNGTSLKVRECNNPVPTNGETYCEGKNTTLEWCNLRECPVYKWGHLKDLNLTIAELKEIMKEEINELKGNLTVDNKNTSSAIRRRISARDDRPSAASFGYFGVVMLATPFVLMVCLDYNHLFPECIKWRIAILLKKVSSSSDST
ncbi:hemicentin-1-like [Mytilus californianus]|uniref:hemicentin-1-like n=1 Tax=Mytilus californianus TaxID=6549 RepID=UPI0022471BF9|nr:hemicentin-1-like [Mytilus californianus]